MKAVTFQGIKDVKEPTLHKPDDIIVKITSTSICGSDLHLIHGMMPNMPHNIITGNEPMGDCRGSWVRGKESKKGGPCHRSI